MDKSILNRWLPSALATSVFRTIIWTSVFVFIFAIGTMSGSQSIGEGYVPIQKHDYSQDVPLFAFETFAFSFLLWIGFGYVVEKGLHLVIPRFRFNNGVLFDIFVSIGTLMLMGLNMANLVDSMVKTFLVLFSVPGILFIGMDSMLIIGLVLFFSRITGVEVLQLGK